MIKDVENPESSCRELFKEGSIPEYVDFWSQAKLLEENLFRHHLRVNNVN